MKFSYMQCFRAATAVQKLGTSGREWKSEKVSSWCLGRSQVPCPEFYFRIITSELCILLSTQMYFELTHHHMMQTRLNRNQQLIFGIIKTTPNRHYCQQKIFMQAALKGIAEIQKCIQSSAPHYTCVTSLPSSVCDHSIVAFGRFGKSGMAASFNQSIKSKHICKAP